MFQRICRVKSLIRCITQYIIRTEFNKLLYGILHVYIVWPHSLILDRVEGTPLYKGSKYKVHLYVVVVNISFHVLDMSRCQWPHAEDNTIDIVIYKHPQL